MTRRNFTRLAVLIAVLVLLLLLASRGRSPFGKSNSRFSIDPQNEITRIELSQKGQKLVLSREGDSWLINGSAEARKSGVLFIIRILREMSIKSPVSPDLFDREIKDKGIAPVQVKVFEGRKLLSSFLVYKTHSNPYGNIMKIKGGSKPFIVSLPGFEGDIGSGFMLNELFWKPYTVYNLMPSEIASVRIENSADTASSFLLNVKDGAYEISDGNHTLAGWDSAMVTRFLSYFTYVPFEAWALDLSGPDKGRIEATTPLFIITVTTRAGTTGTLTLYEKMKSGDGGDARDTDRLYGRINKEGEFFILRYFDIDPLLKKRSYFFHD